MSRCFPFPPPGYEKKPLTDDLDLLKKEKRKEKKHKKDKKDKEKKEGKEKREKDRSESKHKDKKDKHRDKKKEKDRGSKSSTQDEGYNGEKLPLHNHNHIHIHNKEQQIQDKKPPPPPPLHSRNGESTKDNRTSSSSSHSQGQNGDLARNRDPENLKFVQELDRRIRDEEKGTASHQFLLESRRNSFNNKVEMQNPIPRNKINGATPPPPLQPPQPPLLQPPQQPPLERRFDQKEKVQESDDKRGDKRKHKDRDKQRAGKEKDKLKEKSDKEKKKHIKKISSSDLSTTTLNNTINLSSSHILENSEGILKKRKDLESNGVLPPLSHEIEPRPNKMARPISNISPENGRKLDFPQNQIPSSSSLDNQKASSQNNFKTSTKSQKVNGIISSPPFSLPAKKPPIPSSNHIHHKPSPIKSPPPPLLPPLLQQPPPVITNHQLPVKPPPPPQLPVPIAARQPVTRPKPPPAVVAAPPPPPPPKKKVEAVKPPHPDVKYLKQILSVPKPEEFGGFDEQEWLLKAGPPRERAGDVAEEVQVWSEAKQIDSVDVCALPYVIPY